MIIAVDTSTEHPAAFPLETPPREVPLSAEYMPRHLVLEELINVLESVEPERILPVGFSRPHSYRGYYRDLAFCVARNVSVREMLYAARSAMGETFQGWKGGDYTMDKYTDVWLVTEEGDTGESLGSMLLHLMLTA